MTLNNIKDKRKDSGFTIVELLVVIVVIGILAAITIISYTGISSKANTTKALSNAQSVQNVAEIFNVDQQHFPTTVADFTNGSATTKLPSGVTVSGTAPTSSTPDVIQYEYCGATATPGSTGALGARIHYFDYTTNLVSTTIIYAGSGAATIGTATCNTWVPLGN
jgi:type IV pilus assembly protein PilA